MCLLVNARLPEKLLTAAKNDHPIKLLSTIDQKKEISNVKIGHNMPVAFKATAIFQLKDSMESSNVKSTTTSTIVIKTYVWVEK